MQHILFRKTFIEFSVISTLVNVIHDGNERNNNNNIIHERKLQFIINLKWKSELLNINEHQIDIWNAILSFNRLINCK